MAASAAPWPRTSSRPWKTLLGRARPARPHHHRNLRPRSAAAADPRLQLARDQVAGDGRRRGHRGRCRGAERRPLCRRRGRRGAAARRPTRCSTTRPRSANCSRTSWSPPTSSSSTRPTCVDEAALADVETRLRAEMRPGTGVIRAAQRACRSRGAARAGPRQPRTISTAATARMNSSMAAKATSTTISTRSRCCCRRCEAATSCWR